MRFIAPVLAQGLIAVFMASVSTPTTAAVIRPRGSGSPVYEGHPGYHLHCHTRGQYHPEQITTFDEVRDMCIRHSNRNYKQRQKTQKCYQLTWDVRTDVQIEIRGQRELWLSYDECWTAMAWLVGCPKGGVFTSVEWKFFYDPVYGKC